MSPRGVPAARWATPVVRRAGIAWAQATVVVVAQLVGTVLFLWLSARTIATTLPEVIAWIPLLGIAGLLLVAALGQYRRSDGENPAWMGYVLVAAAPFTAFGGDCAVAGPLRPGARLLWSGVRIGVELGDGACQTYLNGALLVLGYALLAVGLLLDDRGLGRFGGRLTD